MENVYNSQKNNNIKSKQKLKKHQMGWRGLATGCRVRPSEGPNGCVEER